MKEEIEINIDDDSPMTLEEELDCKMMEVEEILNWIEENESELKVDTNPIQEKLKEAIENWNPGYLKFHKEMMDACQSLAKEGFFDEMF